VALDGVEGLFAIPGAPIGRAEFRHQFDETLKLNSCLGGRHGGDYLFNVTWGAVLP
jgi:hypothetical protein